MSYTLLAIGPSNPQDDEAWITSGLIKRVIRQTTHAVSGKRIGSRILGIGFDAFLLALRARRRGHSGPYVANNPWIGAALRMTGQNDFVVTGIYAEPGTGSWKVLRRLIGNAPVVTLSKSEAENWNAEGGQAVPVLYGNTFKYPKRKASSGFSIFVGGSSDRDTEAICALEEEVLASEVPVKLTIAVGGSAARRTSKGSIVTRPGRIDQQEFGKLLSEASVVFLPLKSESRAAGHMVLVGALESGVPVVVSGTQGVREYIFGPAIHEYRQGLPILPQLQQVAMAAAGNEEWTRQFWFEHFSLNAYVRRVCEVITAARPL